jgi:hypothetical protein
MGSKRFHRLFIRRRWPGAVPDLLTLLDNYNFKLSAHNLQTQNARQAQRFPATQQK